MRMQRCGQKTVSEFSEKQSHARAQVTPLERTCRQRYTLERIITRSSVLQKQSKVLDRWNLRSPTAHRPLELETQASARAPSPPLERIVKQCRDAGCSNSPLERHFPRSSGSAKSGNPRLHLQAKTKFSQFKTRTLGLNFQKRFFLTQNIMVQSSILRNQSPRVFNSNSISNQFHEQYEHANMHEFKSIQSFNLML